MASHPVYPFQSIQIGIFAATVSLNFFAELLDFHKGCEWLYKSVFFVGEMVESYYFTIMTPV